MIHDIVCFSHLRWNFVYQRPQQILSLAAEKNRIFYVEEAVWDAPETKLEITSPQKNIWVIVPFFSQSKQNDHTDLLRSAVDEMFTLHAITQFILWYYSPMAVMFTSHLQPVISVYDCMDELSAFKFAPPDLISNEQLLLLKADIVFTGGYQLFVAKKEKHARVFLFPSSIDKAHFAIARNSVSEPDDQVAIPHPRLGFFGVIDERMDLELLDEIAVSEPGWQIIMIGPVAKIAPDDLPRRPNIHYLGMKHYAVLPLYLSGWDIALMPFAINDSTRYISPTKTPEYLAGGKRVISTPIADVIDPYEKLNLVTIATGAKGFCSAAREMLAEPDKKSWLSEADRFLDNISWEKTWEGMSTLVQELIDNTFIHIKK